MGYSQAVLVSNQTLYVSGQIGTEPGKTELVPGGARAEAKQAMTNIGELLHKDEEFWKFTHLLTCFSNFWPLSPPIGQSDGKSLSNTTEPSDQRKKPLSPPKAGKKNAKGRLKMNRGPSGQRKKK
ncbi:hypothetical protein niasHT_017129 [Heterodera trifolii]